jgi:3',5'-cyclic AMP phosphodiesterase CpdA
MSNGLSALIKNGLSSCRNGLGANVKAYSSCDYPSGKLTYEPSTAAANSAEKLIEELSLLLTSGRLGAENRAVIIQQFEDASASSSQEEALQVAQQLIVASPEYQTSNIIRKNGYKRSAVNVPGSAIAPYKAIVNIYLHGGMDSFYMLSPHSSCPLYTGKFIDYLSAFQATSIHSQVNRFHRV